MVTMDGYFFVSGYRNSNFNLPASGLRGDLYVWSVLLCGKFELLWLFSYTDSPQGLSLLLDELPQLFCYSAASTWPAHLSFLNGLKFGLHAAASAEGEKLLPLPPGVLPHPPVPIWNWLLGLQLYKHHQPSSLTCICSFSSYTQLVLNLVLTSFSLVCFCFCNLPQCSA